MDDYSQETLHRIQENYDTLIELGICNNDDVITSGGRYFTSSYGYDYSILGRSIQRNTNLKTLYMEPEDIMLSVADRGFFEGIKENSSIHEFKLSGYSEGGYAGDTRNPIGEVGCELLKAFQENNSNLTTLRIWACNIRNASERVIINTTLSSCTNIKRMYFNHNNMTDEQLLPMVEAIRGHRSLGTLSLNYNRFGNVGCQALASLLQDPSCNINTLDIHHNHINNEGAIAIANSLASNNKLMNLDITHNQMNDEYEVQEAFVKLLCNTTSINDIYSSNHTLIDHDVQRRQTQTHFSSLLQMNKCENKSHVAIIKILKFHPNIDIEPLFEWGSNDEKNLMALPYVVAWFDKADEAVEMTRDYLDKREDWLDKTKERKLSAMYQFALAMPLMFIPASHIKTDDKKRKRISM